MLVGRFRGLWFMALVPNFAGYQVMDVFVPRLGTLALHTVPLSTLQPCCEGSTISNWVSGRVLERNFHPLSTLRDTASVHVASHCFSVDELGFGI